jgi:hypothetical protein
MLAQKSKITPARQKRFLQSIARWLYGNDKRCDR